MPYEMILLAAAGIVATALVGLLFIGPLGERIQPLLRFLVSFAIGVFTVTAGNLFFELLESSLSLLHIGLAAAAGAGILWFVTALTPEAHHHHGADEKDCCSPVRHIHPVRILVGDALHNFGDGVMLVPAFLLSPQVGMVSAIGIAIHELVQQLSEFFLLRQAGYRTLRAVFASLLAQSSLFVGILVALLFSESITYAPYLTAVAFGGFAYLVFFDLLPHTKETIQHHGQGWLHIVAFIAGVSVMLLLALVLEHGHDQALSFLVQ